MKETAEMLDDDLDSYFISKGFIYLLYLVIHSFLFLQVIRMTEESELMKRRAKNSTMVSME